MSRTAAEWIDLVLDAGWMECDAGLASGDPLQFPGYASRDAKTESVITADGTVDGLPVVAISFEFDVFGGSMGVVAGERIARAFERAIQRHAAVIALTATGGARMQEGMAALTQMAKTTLARRALTTAGLPFLAYMRSPTTGGVYASFASLADVLWAEPGATVGFAGPRVAAQAKPLMEGSHTAEFSLANGLIDDIVAADRLRARTTSFLRATIAPDEPVGIGTARPASSRAPAASAWDQVQLARHPDRPAGRAIVDAIATDLVELRGDRAGVDDEGVVAGIGRIGGRRVGVIALDRTKPTPPGYRKAYRLLRTAGALGVPLVTLIDTPGADPSSESEAQGIARTIATAFRTVLEHPGPSIAVVTGEGGSGGALALGVTDRVLICQNATFSVIAPEGAAVILKRDDVENVARDLHLTAIDLLELGIADDIVPEPPGGGHTDPSSFIATIGESITRTFADLSRGAASDRLALRRKRWREAGNTWLLG